MQPFTIIMKILQKIQMDRYQLTWEQEWITRKTWTNPSRVLNGSKIREPNRTENRTEPNRNRTDEKTEILPTNYIDSKNCCECFFTSFGFQFGSKILEMPWGIHISKVSVPFSSVLNSIQLGFRVDFRFRAFSNCCNNEICLL